MCLQWNRMRELHIDRSQPLLNRFIVKIRMECIFFVAGHRSRPTSFTTCSRDLGVSHLIATWKSPKEPYQMEWSMFETTSAMAEPTNYKVMRESLIQLSAVLTLICLLRPKAVWLWTPCSITTFGVTQPARLRFQTSRAGKAHPKKDWLIAVPYYLVDPEVKAPKMNEFVIDLDSIAFSRGTSLQDRFNASNGQRVTSSNVGEDGLDNCWTELWTIKHSDLMGLLQWTGQGYVPQSLAPSTFKFNWSESFWNRFQITQISTKSFNKSGVFRFVAILS